MPDSENWKTAIAKNNGVIAIGLGLIIILIACAERISFGDKFSLTFTSLIPQILVGFSGAAVVCVGAFIVLKPRMDYRQKGEGDYKLKPMENCEFKISYPLDGSEVGDEVTVTGTYVGGKDEVVVLMEESPYSGNYWFKSKIFRDASSSSWRATSKVAGEPGNERVFHVATLGQSGLVLYHYFKKVGEETEKWPGIKELPKDIRVLASIKVRKKKTPAAA
jgi:hypothetical protein